MPLPPPRLSLHAKSDAEAEVSKSAGLMSKTSAPANLEDDDEDDDLPRRRRGTGIRAGTGIRSNMGKATKSIFARPNEKGFETLNWTRELEVTFQHFLRELLRTQIKLCRLAAKKAGHPDQVNYGKMPKRFND